MEKESKEQYGLKAREAGWTETTAFDYDQFTRTGGNDGDWHGAGKKYEWNEEYGDVAPAIPELEHILFGGEFLMGRGDHFENLEMEVNIEGPLQLAPVQTVSHITVSSTTGAMLKSLSVRRCWSSSSGTSQRQARQL